MTATPGAVLVLGASRGLGRAIVLALAAAGHAVGAACRSATDAAEVVAAVEAAGGKALAITADVTRQADCEAAVAAVVARFGAFAGLVVNAGVIEPIGRIADTDPAAWARAIEVNLVGAFHGVRAALPHLAAGGVVVNVSSGAASNPLEGWSAYCAGKAGLAMLTRSLHLEYGERGILAYGLRPGVVDTDMQASIRASGVNPVSRLRREDLAPPEVPAAAVAWLFAARPADLAGGELDVRDAALKLRMGTGITPASP